MMNLEAILNKIQHLNSDELHCGYFNECCDVVCDIIGKLNFMRLIINNHITFKFDEFKCKQDIIDFCDILSVYFKNVVNRNTIIICKSKINCETEYLINMILKGN